MKKFISVLVIFQNSSHAAIYDKNAKGPDADLLRERAPAVERSGIDTVLGNAIEFKASAKSRLAPLRGYRTKDTNWDTIGADAWALGFQEGMFGAPVAMKPSRLTDDHAECELHHPCPGTRRRLKGMEWA